MLGLAMLALAGVMVAGLAVHAQIPGGGWYPPADQPSSNYPPPAASTYPPPIASATILPAVDLAQRPVAPHQPTLPVLPPVDSPPLPEALPDLQLPTVDLSVEAAPAPPPRIWSGSLELGLDGTEGHSDTFNFRFGADAERKTDSHELTFDLDYRRQTDRSQETANRGLLDWRWERLFENSPWTCFTHGTVEHDEFQAFDLRVASDVGVGYQFIDSEATTLAGRFGGGFSHEIGGPDDSYVPEAVFGLDFERRCGDRHKIGLTIDYAPDVTDFAAYRLKTKAFWEALIDEEMNLSLKLSVLDRYDSTPHNAVPNDVDYSIVLLWKF